MLKLTPILLALALPMVAHAAPQCAIPPLPGSDKTPKAAAAVKTLRATDPCKTVPGLTAKSLASVWDGLLAYKKTGGRRLEPVVPDGLPNGTVLPGAAGVHFDFRAVAAEEIRSFRLEADRQILINGAAPPLDLNVPPARGEQAEYQWVLVTRLNTYKGSYTVIDSESRREVEQQLAALDGSALDDVSRLLYKAAIFDEAALYADRDRIFATLQKHVGP